MIPLRRRILLKAFKLFDVLVMVFSFLLALAAVSRSSLISLEQFLEMRVKIQNFALFLGFCLAWHAIFSFFDLYHSRRLSTLKNEIFDVMKATALGTIVIGASGYVLKLIAMTPAFVMVFWAASTAVGVSSRIVLRYALERVRVHGRNLRHLLIIGTNPRALQFARKIEATPELGYHLLGFVDEGWAGTGKFEKAGYKVVSDLASFPAFIRNQVVDEVAVALPVSSFYKQISQIVGLCEKQGIVVRFLSNLFDLKVGKSRGEQIGDDSVVTVYTGSMRGWRVLVKLALDFCLSAILIFLLSPLFLATAALIKLTSRGPVFFTQERVGLNKRRFRLYKFRTMIPGAETKLAELEEFNEVSGPVFKIKNDPRVTPVGRLLRKTSVDELPQLFNVLKGDMSLVGPRPLPVRDYEGFDEDWHRRRFSVRPGITCLWQVNGRSGTTFEKWMELDMEYIDGWSLWLDMKILAKTVPAVLRGTGAA